MEPLGPGIWAMTFPFQTRGIHFGTRTTVVETADGFVLISPGPMEQYHFTELAAVGQVSALVAPNTMHHLFLNQAAEWYPRATVYIPPNLLKKRPDLRGARFHHQGKEQWGEVLDQVPVQGVPELEETVFFHPLSGTLILTDLAFNLTRCDHWLTRQAMRLNGVLGRFGPSRLLKGFFLRDPSLFAKSIEQILEWPFQTVVVGHGEILKVQARETFARAFQR